MNEALDIKVSDVRIGIANIDARIPFRFGSTTVSHVAHATVAVQIETRSGVSATGYAADFLSYAWFDKSPEKSPEQGSRELLVSIQAAADAWQTFGFGTAFGQWREIHPQMEEASLARGHNKLGGNFGVSMIERAVIDAIGRMIDQSFHDMICGDVLGIDETTVFPELSRGSVRKALPEKPLHRVDLRHTVGLVDPLTAADNTAPIADGLPETLEEYLRQQKLRFLKIKISANPEETLSRLMAICTLIKSHPPITITLDGNEQFKDLASFTSLVERIRTNPSLETLWRSVLFIEQPVERNSTMENAIEDSEGRVIEKPLLIDESDGWTAAFLQAMQLGYRGVSHKNCKGVFRSFLNNALAASRNKEAGSGHFFLSAEDLSCLPNVSLNADLATVSSLGIGHVERNGHHYFRGLKHLTDAEQDNALSHTPLYIRQDGLTVLNVQDGELDTSSLNCPGYGFSGVPDLDHLAAPEEWRFAG